MKISRTTVLLIFAIILVGMIAAVYGYFFKIMRTSNDRIAQLILEAQQNEDALAMAQSLRKVGQEVEPELKKLDSYFVGKEKDDDVRFIEMIENLGQSLGLTTSLSSATYVDEGKVDVVDMLRLSVSFEGSWSSGMNFISLLEKMPYDIMIRNLSFSSRGATWSGEAEIEVLKLK